MTKHYDNLVEHVSHEITLGFYGDADNASVSLECIDCDMVIAEFPRRTVDVPPDVTLVLKITEHVLTNPHLREELQGAVGFGTEDATNLLSKVNRGLSEAADVAQG